MNKRMYLIMIISIPLLWIAAIKITNFPSFVIPPPELVVDVLVKESNIFFEHTTITVTWALMGYLASNVLAIGMAISFTYLPWFESFATPWTVLIKNVPFVAIASILVITMGQTPLPRVIVVVLVTFFVILANVTKGLKSVDQVLLDRMETLDASKWQIFWNIRWPSALPYYIASHEIAFTGSVIGAIIAEWMFAKNGLGYLIVRSMSQYRADRLYAVVLISSALSVGAYILVKVIESRMFKWKREISNGI